MSDGPFEFSEELADLVCDVLREHGPDRHVDGYEQMSQAMVKFFNARYHELHPPVSEGMRFTIGDFAELFDNHGLAAKLANTKLQRILAQGVRVYCEKRLYPDSDGEYFVCSGNMKSVLIDATHTGIVINIKELK